eukprot:3804355-Rhodomonas_salina.1
MGGPVEGRREGVGDHGGGERHWQRAGRRWQQRGHVALQRRHVLLERRHVVGEAALLDSRRHRAPQCLPTCHSHVRRWCARDILTHT